MTKGGQTKKTPRRTFYLVISCQLSVILQFDHLFYNLTIDGIFDTVAENDETAVTEHFIGHW